MKSLSFYNVKTKKKFTTSNYTIKLKSGRRFAVALNAGVKCHRILGKD